MAAGRFYVVADDELQLGCFDAEAIRPGRLQRLLPGTLPGEPAARKATKPDFEVLARLPSGDLFAIGSGSTPGRCTAALLPLGADGLAGGAARAIDMSALRSALLEHFASPNIEGGCVMGTELLLLQRANARDRSNALVALPLGALESAIDRGGLEAGEAALRTVTVELQGPGDVALSFTDCAALPDGRIVFTAVAEDTPNSYDDGPCSAAAVGLLDRQGRVLRMSMLEPTRKVEGVHAWLEGGTIRLLMVTDADDARVPAELLACEIA